MITSFTNIYTLGVEDLQSYQHMYTHGKGRKMEQEYRNMHILIIMLATCSTYV